MIEQRSIPPTICCDPDRGAERQQAVSLQIAGAGRSRSTGDCDSVEPQLVAGLVDVAPSSGSVWPRS